MNDSLRSELVDGDYLCADHINIFIEIVKERTPFHPVNPYLIAATEFVPRSDDRHVQILSGLTGSVKEVTHWICSYYDGTVLHIYDSLNLQHLSKDQLCFFNHLHPLKDRISFEQVQQQPNGVDCGVFAIAFATSLILNRDPTTEIYRHGEMRKHLLRIFESRTISAFPTLGPSPETSCAISADSRKRKWEQNQTPGSKNIRLEKARERMKERRSRETPEEREIRLEKQRKRRKQKKENEGKDTKKIRLEEKKDKETEEMKKKRLEQDRERVKEKRDNKTEEISCSASADSTKREREENPRSGSKKIQVEKARERMKERRNRETPEEREIRLEKQRKRRKQKKENEGKDTKKIRLEEKKDKETEEMKKKRLEQDRERVKEKRDNETEEISCSSSADSTKREREENPTPGSKKIQVEKARERMKERRNRETPEEREIRLEKQRKRRKQKKENESKDTKKIQLERCRESVKEKRNKETEEMRKRRLEQDRKRLKEKRDEESEEMRKTRLERERERMKEKRDNETEEVKKQRLEDDRERVNEKRDKETENARKIRLEKDKQNHQNARSGKSCAIPQSVLHEFEKLFNDNEFGFACSVCDRLWFKNDLRQVPEEHVPFLEPTFPGENVGNFVLCSNCFGSIKSNRIPAMSRSNGFKYPELPSHLPPLDPVVERLISPRLPFMQIRRLRQHYGSYRIMGQIINIPVDVDQMVNELPRNLSDDRAFTVNIKKNLIHNSVYLSGVVKKSVVKEWLKYLVSSPLYKKYDVKIKEEFMSQEDQMDRSPSTEELEDINPKDETELLMGQQQTLLWNESKCLDIAPGQNKQPLSIIYDTYAEEASYPSIYLGHPRIFKQGVRVTAFMIATSEIRRKDRRGATPNHILYVAMKILRLRVSEALHSTFKCIGNTENITRRMIEDRKFLELCAEKNLSFLKSIPNSAQYWCARKNDLFAMIRQLGSPTMFMTLSADEVRWPNLLKILHRLSGTTSDAGLYDPMAELNALKRSTLVNEDPVTCCVYFNKLLHVIMRLLSNSNKSKNPFGKYRVKDFFIRIEFQHRGSPHAHILLWLENDPHEAVSENMPLTVELIDSLCAVSFDSLPDSYHKQVHKHTFTCYKKGNTDCRFHIPYWPSDQTRILLPMTKEDGRRNVLKTRAHELHKILEMKSYDTFAQFLSDNNLTLEYYLDMIRASIKRPTVLFRRNMQEIWTNTFNPLVAMMLNSNMDLQFIIDEYSCAAYVTEYVNKSNRGISSLHRDLIQLQQEYPDQDYTCLLKTLGIKILNSVEMTSQEAAWYLLRQPMSESSVDIVFVPTTWPHERSKCHKTKRQMDQENLDENSKDVWSKNIIQKYEERMIRNDDLKHVCLADFATKYSAVRGSTNIYRLRDRPRILRYVKYEMHQVTEHKREMVLLYYPFASEHVDLLDRNKFLDLFNEHREQILLKRQEYESGLDLEKFLEELENVTRGLEEGESADADLKNETYLEQGINCAPNMDDMQYITPTGTSTIGERQNVMPKEEYCAALRTANQEQRELILQAINCIHARPEDKSPLQIFLTGPAGSGKTFTLKLLMETYNRFTLSHNSNLNAYLACASTGKAAVNIGATTVHSGFHLAKSRRKNQKPGLSQELLQSLRYSFRNVIAVFLDEVSMIGANILHDINSRLGDITGNFDDPFGGMDIIFCGDPNQLPPVNARPIYKPHKDSIAGAFLWQSLDYYPLRTVVRQSDVKFSNMLTKIGNGECLSAEETDMINSRFRSEEWCKSHLPHVVRLFHRNVDVDAYNLQAFEAQKESVAEDLYSGYKNQEQLASARNKLHKMNVAETAGLPYILRLCVDKPYMITTNIDVPDGLVNGAVGELKHIEYEDGSIKRLWLSFDNERIGTKSKIKSKPLVASFPKILNPTWVPIVKRTANIVLSTQIKCRRLQFPLSPSLAMTIHKSQGATLNRVVFRYDKKQDQQLVYVALSRVTSIEGLYLTNTDGDFHFHHSKGSTSPKMIELKSELRRLENHRLQTISDALRAFVDAPSYFGFITLNVQSLTAHSADVACDDVFRRFDVLCLTETWLNDHVAPNVGDFVCITQNKRKNKRAGGVAIYKNCNSNLSVSPYEISLTDQNLDDACGDICAVKINIDGKEVVLCTIYISHDASFTDLKTFLTHNLPSDATSMFLCGDFNLDINNPKHKDFPAFMDREYRLKFESTLNGTTLNNTTIDMVFSRNIQNVSCLNYITYFSYHRPIATTVRRPQHTSQLKCLSFQP